jgi:hypothetical protein
MNVAAKRLSAGAAAAASERDRERYLLVKLSSKSLKKKPRVRSGPRTYKKITTGVWQPYTDRYGNVNMSSSVHLLGRHKMQFALRQTCRFEANVCFSCRLPIRRCN